MKIPHSKREIKAMAEGMAGLMINGQEPLLVYYLKLRAAREILSMVEDEISPDCISEAEENGKEGLRVMGATIRLIEKGVRYDFSVCGDAQWAKLDDEIKRLQELRKIREKELKARLHNNAGLDCEGQQREQPPHKSSKRGLRVELPAGN